MKVLQCLKMYITFSIVLIFIIQAKKPSNYNRKFMITILIINWHTSHAFASRCARKINLVINDIIDALSSAQSNNAEMIGNFLLTTQTNRIYNIRLEYHKIAIWFDLLLATAIARFLASMTVIKNALKRCQGAVNIDCEEVFMVSGVCTMHHLITVHFYAQSARKWDIKANIWVVFYICLSEKPFLSISHFEAIHS